MQIVIVERDAALGSFLQKGLQFEGHGAVWFADEEPVLEHMRACGPDLLLLDAGAAEHGVPELLTAARGVKADLAILALLERDLVAERVRCLDMGADDCMTKPFSFQELTARCRALQRRRARSGEDVVLRCGDLVLNRVSRKVTLGADRLHLTTKEFALLEMLMQRRGACCGRSELLREAFQLPEESPTNVVDVYINYLRKKLKAQDGGQEIVTVRNAGYKLVLRPDAAGFERRGVDGLRLASV